jgi:hypothetical protein
MKKVLLLISGILIQFQSLFAQNILRCNNDPTIPATGNVYRTIQQAHNAASDGDIIYVEPSFSSVSYGDLTVSKGIKIIGNGYDINENKNLIAEPADSRSSILGNINIQSGVGVILEGLDLQSVYIGAPNTIIRRCKFLGGYSNVLTLERNDAGRNASGSTVLHCYFAGINGNINVLGYSVSNNNISTPIHVENVSFINCLFRSGSFNVGNVTGGNGNVNNGTYSLPAAKGFVFANNYMLSMLRECYECQLFSNIFGSGANFDSGYRISNTVASHNMCFGSSCPYGNNNLVSTENSEFSGWSGSPIGQILLESASAKNAGLNGTDMGIFGGANPFRLSGLPAVPIITEYSKNASSGIYTNSSPMSVTISIQSNN